MQTCNRMQLRKHMGTESMEKHVSTFLVLPATLFVPLDIEPTLLLKTKERSAQLQKWFTAGKWGKSSSITSHVVKVSYLDRFCTLGYFTQYSVILLVKFNLKVMENRIFPKSGKEKREKISRQSFRPEQVCSCFSIVT